MWCPIWDALWLSITDHDHQAKNDSPEGPLPVVTHYVPTYLPTYLHVAHGCGPAITAAHQASLPGYIAGGKARAAW